LKSFVFITLPTHQWVASSSLARFTKLLTWDLGGSEAVQNAGRRHTHEERQCRVPEELLFLACYGQ